MTIIYGLCDPTTGELRYVGKTSLSLNVRLSRHLRNARSGCRPHVNAWIRGLLAKGLVPDAFEIEPTAEWRTAERFWIQYFRFIGCRLVNTDPGGGGIAMTPEIAAKISATRRERGLGLSPECVTRSLATRAERWKDSAFRAERAARTSDTQKALWSSPHHREKMSIERKARWKIAPNTKWLEAVKEGHRLWAERRRLQKVGGDA